MRRSDASPDAETRSYWPPPPPDMSATIWSEDPAYLAFTWQPVCCSNGLTHCGCVYPSHAMTLSCPSPLPMCVSMFALLGPDEPPPPHADSATLTAVSAAAQVTIRVSSPAGVRFG